MVTNFKIKGQDIGQTLETFTLTEKNNYKVPDSEFTNGDNDYKNRGSDLGMSINIPTSAGNNFAGGQHLVQEYKKKWNPIDAALKGRRPIGKLILVLDAVSVSGFYTIYRKNGQLFYAAGENITTGGTRLCSEHDPEYIHIEMVAGGGGGGGSSFWTGGQGGGAGSYILMSLKADKIILWNARGGHAGGKDDYGGSGEDGIIWFDNGGYTYKIVCGHGRQGVKGSNTEHGGEDDLNSQNHGKESFTRYGRKIYDGKYYSGNTAAYSDFILDTQQQINDFNNLIGSDFGKILYSKRGGWGLARDNVDKGYQAFITPWQERFDRPETNYTIQRGGTFDGYVGDYAHGGGGGPSVLANGGKANSRANGNPGSFGSGGAGGSYDGGRKHEGSRGGDGIVYIYY